MANSSGNDVPLDARVLEAGAAALQDFAPVRSICAHLNAFHVYADESTRFVEANHYCAHITEDVRQCLLYDSPAANARLIGVEYMVTPRVFAALPAEEKKLWHSHVFEVKSGMLIMPGPTAPWKLHAGGRDEEQREDRRAAAGAGVSTTSQIVGAVPGGQAVWEAAETKEMEQVVELYGKVYHLWQVDKGHEVPLGEPQLMTSFTEVGQMGGQEKFEKIVGERDSRFGVDWRRKKELRKGIKDPKLDEAADATWRRNSL